MKRILLAIVLTFVAVCYFPGAARAGSKFYLTVDRSFSPTEHPRIRLDFLDLKEPLQLRVLRPKNVNAFLDGQLNLSRAYEEPRSQINPGHYFSKGLNKVSSPIFELRTLLSEKFRNGFGGEDFNDPLALRPDADVAGVPDEITQGPPAGFDVVRQLFVDLQRGGEVPQGLYDWDDSYWSEKYNVRQLDLEPLPDGIYLVQAVQGKDEAQALLQISSLVVQVKQSSQQLLFRVIDRGLAAVAGAEISLRDSRGDWRLLPEKTDADGEVMYESGEGPLDGRLVAKIGASGERVALVETDFLPAASSDKSLFVLTDRPIFKPGETFHFKGLLRQNESGQVQLPNPLPAETTVTLESSDGRYRSPEMSVSLTPFGSFSGDFALSPVQPPGLYRVVAKVNSLPYAGELRVRDYVKPTFYLELLQRDPVITPGEEFHLKIRARRFSGGVPPDGRYEVFVYRQRFEAPAFVADAGGALTAGNDYFGATRSAAPLAQPQRLFSSVEARAQEQGVSESGNTWATAATFDQVGEADIKIAIPQAKAGPATDDSNYEWTYTVVVRAMDSTGAFANLSESLYRTKSEVVASLQSAETVVEPQATEVPFYIRATYPDGKPAPQVSGELVTQFVAPNNANNSGALPQAGAGREVSQFVTDNDGFAKVSVKKPAQPGKLVATANLLKLNGRDLSPVASSTAAVAVLTGSNNEAVTSGEALQLFSNGTVLTPGEKRAVFVAFPQSWGHQEQGKIWTTISGDKIYSHAAEAVSGRGMWLNVEARPEYGSGFYYSVGVPVRPGKMIEETVGFRVVPQDKRLSIQVQPEPNDAQPLQPYKLGFLVKDSSGSAAPDVELAVSVVDRSVYAVQPEFRPEVGEFFYPLPRLNVATFNSDELQGYGYADEISKPNFSLTALKSQIKPQKRSMRDTAGWFPHVVTDSSGRAEVTLEMPANVTEWLVTVVALDKNGRLGEGTGRFNSSSDIVVDPRAPQFLREGDLIHGNMVIENKSASDQTLGLELLSSGGAQITQADFATQVIVPAAQQAMLPFTMTGIVGESTAKSGSGILELRTTPASSPDLRVGGPQQFDVQLLRNSARLPFQGYFNPSDGSIGFPELANDVTPSELKIFVTKGVTGAILALSSQLVSYPWGCTEQLIHTTLPNVILLDVLRRAGIGEQTLSVLPDSLGLRDAKAYAELGIQKLLRNQKANGAFGLWPGDAEGSLPLSLMTASALKLAADAGVKSAGAALQNVRSYLSSATWNNEGEAFDIESRPYRGLMLAYAAENELWGSLRERFASYVNEVKADKKARLDELVFASKILRHVKEAWWFSEEFGDDSKKLQSQLVGRIQTILKKVNLDMMVFPVSELVDELGFQYGGQSVVAGALGELQEVSTTGAGVSEFAPLMHAMLMRARYVNYSTVDAADLVFALRNVVLKEQRERAADTIPMGEDSNSPVLEFVAADTGATGGTASSANATQKLTAIPGGYYFDSTMAAGRSSGRPLKLNQVPSDGIVLITASANVPYTKLSTMVHGLSVTRQLYRVEPSGAVPLAAEAPLRVGDVLLSQVTIARSPANKGYSPASRFVVVEDAVPAVAEAIDDDRSILADAKILSENPDSWWSRVKQTIRYSDKSARVMEIRPGGSGTFYQAYRVSYRGTAMLPPAYGYDMYSSDVAGISDSLSLKVE